MIEGDADKTGDGCLRGESFSPCDGEGGEEVRKEDEGEWEGSTAFLLLEEEEEDVNVTDEMDELELERDAWMDGSFERESRSKEGRGGGVMSNGEGVRLIRILCGLRSEVRISRPRTAVGALNEGERESDWVPTTVWSMSTGVVDGVEDGPKPGTP